MPYGRFRATPWVVSSHSVFCEAMSLTIFSIPKPFIGHIAVIQRNALASWRRLEPRPEIILFGDEAGVAEAARDFDAHHELRIATNEHGTPLVSDAFYRAVTVASNELLVFSNADILYNDSLVEGASSARLPRRFLMGGRRWDVDVPQRLDAADSDTWKKLFADHERTGRLHGPAGMDYFIFPRTMALNMPQFAVGRVGWDSWLVWKCRMEGIPVIDATRSITALHQNHDYTQLKLGYQHARGPERDLNIRAAGGLSHLLTLREADWHLVHGGLTRPPWPQRVFAILGTSPLYQRILAFKRARN